MTLEKQKLLSCAYYTINPDKNRILFISDARILPVKW